VPGQADPDRRPQLLGADRVALGVIGVEAAQRRQWQVHHLKAGRPATLGPAKYHRLVALRRT
jgi:hypothetical protein